MDNIGYGIIIYKWKETLKKSKLVQDFVSTLKDSYRYDASVKYRISFPKDDSIEGRKGYCTFQVTVVIGGGADKYVLEIKIRPWKKNYWNFKDLGMRLNVEGYFKSISIDSLETWKEFVRVGFSLYQLRGHQLMLAI